MDVVNYYYYYYYYHYYHYYHYYYYYYYYYDCSPMGGTRAENLMNFSWLFMFLQKLQTIF